MYTEAEEFTPEQLDGVQILDEHLYSHKMLRINYTTYDMRREQDCIAPRRHADVMVPAPEFDDTRFWYTRVIGIFHVNTRYVGSAATPLDRRWRRMDLLWVHWFTRDTSIPSGFQHRRQPCLQFVNANNPDNDPFGLINPDDVIRAAYIMPAFDTGLTDSLLDASKLACKNPVHPGDDKHDYMQYEVSMYVGR